MICSAIVNCEFSAKSISTTIAKISWAVFVCICLTHFPTAPPSVFLAIALCKRLIAAINMRLATSTAWWPPNRLLHHPSRSLHEMIEDVWTTSFEIYSKLASKMIRLPNDTIHRLRNAVCIWLLRIQHSPTAQIFALHHQNPFNHFYSAVWSFSRHISRNVTPRGGCVK